MKILLERIRKSHEEDDEEMMSTNAIIATKIAHHEAENQPRGRGSHPGRAPNDPRQRDERADLRRLLAKGEKRGFPGMIGSINCMNWQWKNCLTGWAGEYSGRKRIPTIILEAVASYDSWIWHAFFGMSGSCNDLNVLAKSPLFDELIAGRAPHIQFQVNNRVHSLGYYLADGIFPRWATFVETIPHPRRPKDCVFAKAQEGYRKDVERCFDILQSYFGVFRGTARGWDK
ncbi:uncharacterized protein LOC126792073 [Argentina anserina]|uniref:uncharacterized protein LOC126792073 n=1 Tax=Argentina anserina TaxID=57926 RepID=UPI0021768F11|nr:uncharacterized protein LOC126792073 [Potentilla anserina]